MVAASIAGCVDGVGAHKHPLIRTSVLRRAGVKAASAKKAWELAHMAHRFGDGIADNAHLAGWWTGTPLCLGGLVASPLPLQTSPTQALAGIGGGSPPGLRPAASLLPHRHTHTRTPACINLLRVLQDTIEAATHTHAHTHTHLADGGLHVQHIGGPHGLQHQRQRLLLQRQKRSPGCGVADT